MAPRQDQPLVFTQIRGRDGSSASMLDIPVQRARECLNVDFHRASLGRKRGGSTDVMASTSGADTASVVATLARHVPGADETAAELWQVTGAATPILQRLAGGTAWSTITVSDAIASRPQDAWPVTFNGKLFWFYDSTQSRSHVFDPAFSTTALRRMGLASPTSAPTVTDTGSGSYAATERHYRTRDLIQSGGNTVLLSDPSPSVSFTPSGSGASAQITKPADMGEGATHWRLEEARTSAGPWYIIATTAVATTTYDDSASVTSIINNEASAESGQHAVPSSFKYGIADGARLLLAGAWESDFDPSTVFYTPTIGTTSAVYYDDERVPSNNRMPLDPKDGGVITGFGGPFENQVVVFKQRQTWRLVPTTIEADPYRRKAISKVVGCVRQHSVVMAEDETGNATLYWLSHLGPYRYNLRSGLQKLVWDVKDIWDTVNLAASTVTCHGVYHSDIHQIWWWVATGSSNEPDTKIVFDTRLGRVTELGDVRDGWCKHTGESAKARCSVMFSNTLGASMSRDLKPYIGQHGGIGRIWKCDTSDATDNGTAFQGLITLPDKHLGGPLHACAMGSPLITGEAGAYDITVSATPNYDTTRTVSDAVSMQATGGESRVKRRLEGVTIGDADVYAVALAVGDAEAASTVQWVLDELVVPVEQRESLRVA